MGEEEKRGHVYGTVKVGDRGQVVIPAQARKDLDLKPGDVLLVMTGKYGRGLSMVKADAVREFANQLLTGLEEPKPEK
jgi:AbrB family looped-hinge helix DNA binding protein